MSITKRQDMEVALRKALACGSTGFGIDSRVGVALDASEDFIERQLDAAMECYEKNTDRKGFDITIKLR